MIDKNIEVSRYFQKLGFTVSLLDEELTLPLHRFSEVEQAIQQELLKARIDELNRYDTDEDMYKTLRTVYLQAKLKGDE